MSIGERLLGATSARSPDLWVRHAAVDPDLGLGSLRSANITVVADDGVPLHAEIDEAVPMVTRGRRAKHAAPPPVTLAREPAPRRLPFFWPFRYIEDAFVL